MTVSSEGPFISVIVPAKNSAGTISACVDSLQLHLPENRSEIIVVDNDSTDGTGDIACRKGITVLAAPGVNVSEVRNVGARRATGELLAFIDSDCTIEAGWYSAVAELMGGDPSIAVTGSRHLIPVDATWVERTWFNANRATAGAGPREVAYIPAGNMIVRKEDFAGVAGFDSTLETGEDPDLCKRIASMGRRIVESDRISCVHHGEPKTLLQVFRRERWHGRGVRLRYATGRIAPVVAATGFFLVMLIFSVAGLAVSGSFGPAVPAAALAAAIAVPVLFALVKGSKLSKVSLPALVLIYGAYFLGRAVSLPGALWRGMSRKGTPANV